MKLTKTQIENAQDFMNLSAGSGKYISRRALPFCVYELEKKEFELNKERCFSDKKRDFRYSNKVGKFFNKNPKVRKILIADVAYFKREIKKYEIL